MKKSSLALLLLSVVGMLFLLAAPFWLHFPAMGWVVWATITVLFGWGMRNSWRALQDVEAELALLRSLPEELPEVDPADTSVVSTRIALVRRLAAEGKDVHAGAFSEVISAKESVRGGTSFGGHVIILGAIGTFSGLILVLVGAAPTLVQGQTLDVGQVVQPLLAGMRGIFGTSLVGLVAAMILNLGQSILHSSQVRFMAELEEFTQFRLLPSFRQGGENPLVPAVARLERSVQQLEERLAKVGAGWDSGLSGLESRLGGWTGEWTGTLAKLSEQQQGLAQKQLEGLEALRRESREEWSAQLGKSGEQVSQKLGQASEEFAGKLSAALEGFGTRQQGYLAELQQGVAELLGKLQAEQSTRMEQLVAGRGEVEAQAAAAMGERLEALRQVEQALAATVRESLAGIVDAQQKALANLGSGWEEMAGKLGAQADERMAAWGNALGERLGASADQIRGLAEVLGTNLQDLVARTSELVAGLQGEAGQMAEITLALEEAGSRMTVNQVEMQAVIEMFGQGVEELVQAFGSRQEEAGDEKEFFAKLEATLGAFHEKASEVLLDSSVRTQEILLEVLRQAQTAPASGGAPAAVEA
jgi:hypothetical protein